MPVFAYLGNYALTTTDDVNFSMTFYIPDNCHYSVTGSNGLFCIAIVLNTGEPSPTVNFLPHTEPFLIYRDNLEVDFLMPDQRGQKKPKVIISTT